MPLLWIVAVCLLVPVSVDRWRKQQHRKLAESRRHEMDNAVAIFLDLVNVLLAGGAGIESSLLAASQAGNNWAFRALRNALLSAQSARQSSWDALRELGEQLNADSLIDLSHSVQLAGEHGARVRQTLLQRSASLRLHNLARAESVASDNTEKMGIPMVVLFVAFIVLVGYPAYVTAIGAL